MKTCFKCCETKPLSEFYRHKRMADGHLNKCKECTKRDVFKHRRGNLERIREYDRTRAKLPHRIALNSEIAAEYRRLFPERYKANTAVSNALRDGRLVKTACQHCGAEDVEAHHPDYSQPLSVVWLCPADHHAIHLAYPDDYYDQPNQAHQSERPDWQRQTAAAPLA